MNISFFIRTLIITSLGLLHSTAFSAPLPSLAKAYEQIFPIGAAITPGEVMVPQTANFIARQYNIIVAENAMKPQSLNRDGPGLYTFENADRIVDFAFAHQIEVRGHALVWHQQTADWMFRGSGPDGYATREELTERLHTYIHDVVTHFKGRVYAWDVVNEAFIPDEKGAQENGWRTSNWYRILGPSYIELAFRFAHEADPDALLFYNDYNTESPHKRAMILELIHTLQDKGLPIHGVGHQSHYSMAYPKDFSGLETTIEEVSKLGLTNQITELDISIHLDSRRPDVEEATPALLKGHAERYKQFFDMALRQRKHISAVLMWGLHDEVSWLRYWPSPRFDAPLLFDGKLRPKPAFWAVIKLAPTIKP